MKDYLNIGPAPCDEDCVQVSKDHDYGPAQRKECNRFIRAIRAVLGPEPDGARLAVKGFPHDFGTYYEVVCWYDGAVPEAVDYANRCETEAPATWPLDEEYVRLLLPDATIEHTQTGFNARTQQTLAGERLTEIQKSPYFGGIIADDDQIVVIFAD